MQSAVEVAPPKQCVMVQQTGIQPQHQQDVKTLWVGDLQYWMDENYLHTAFERSGLEVLVCTLWSLFRNDSDFCAF
jgi:hypothetical protein